MDTPKMEIHKKTIYTVLWVFAGLLLVASWWNAEGLIFFMAIIIFLYKERLANSLHHSPLPLAFIGSGTIFGLFTELIRILNNVGVPTAQKTLLHPNLAMDLLLGLFHYGMFTIAWYFILQKRCFSKKAVFILSGIFGLIITEKGLILGNVLFHPLSGFFLAFFGMGVYGIFPLCAYLLTEERFPERPTPRAREYLTVLFCLFIVWAIYENIFAEGVSIFFE